MGPDGCAELHDRMMVGFRTDRLELDEIWGDVGNPCRVHEALRTTPGVALGIADRVWTIGDLLDATLAIEPKRPLRVKRDFTAIEGGKD